MRSSRRNRYSSAVGNQQLGCRNAGAINGLDPSEWWGIIWRYPETRSARQARSDAFASQLLSCRTRLLRCLGRDQVEDLAGFLFRKPIDFLPKAFLCRSHTITHSFSFPQFQKNNCLATDINRKS